jgi:hypothetical protein
VHRRLIDQIFPTRIVGQFVNQLVSLLLEHGGHDGNLVKE